MQEEIAPQLPKETVPSVLDQAAALGWGAGIYSFGKAEQPGYDYFNPGLVERPDGLWLLVRRAEMGGVSPVGMNDVCAIKLDETGRNPQQGVVLEWPDRQIGQQFEDARGFYNPMMKQVGVSACTFQWFGDDAQPPWSGAIQVLAFFDEDWKCKVLHYPPFETNATALQVVPREAYQKNWIWWERAGRLHLLYHSEPWTVATIENHWTDGRMVYTGKPLTWPYGTVRGGTPPVEIDGMMVTFFHSSTPWYGRWRRYHMGAIAFNPEPPFEPLMMTQTPLISGSTKDPWGLGKPPCVFPCGLVLRDNKFFITAGINDVRAGWFEASVESVMARMTLLNSSKIAVAAPVIEFDAKELVKRVEAAAGVAKVSTETYAKAKPKKRKLKRRYTPEALQKLRDNMAKARAARK